MRACRAIKGRGEVFLREGTLLAKAFDLGRLEVTGEAFPVAEQVASYRNMGQFSSAIVSLAVSAWKNCLPVSNSWTTRSNDALFRKSRLPRQHSWCRHT